MQSDIQGHWRRDWLRARGFEDRSTRVHWMQAGAVYADVRIPQNRPDLGGAACLADLPETALQALSKAEGFAGTTDITDGVCTWTRAINWHGATAEIDAGRLWFDETGGLVEDGVHAEYRELWQRQTDGPATAVCLTCGGFAAYIVTVGESFVFGAGNRDAQASAPWQELFDRVHAFGRWEDETGYAILATNPFLEGRPILERKADHMIWHRQDLDAACSRVELS